MSRQWIEIPAGTTGTIIQTGKQFRFHEIEVTEALETIDGNIAITGGITVAASDVHKINPAAWTWAR